MATATDAAGARRAEETILDAQWDWISTLYVDVDVKKERGEKEHYSGPGRGTVYLATAPSCYHHWRRWVRPTRLSRCPSLRLASFRGSLGPCRCHRATCGGPRGRHVRLR